MRATPFRVAHLSDLHQRQALPGTAAVARRRSREHLLKRALEVIVEQRVDLLVLTGDLLDVPQFLYEGVPQGFASPGHEERWLEAAREDYRSLRRMLEATGIAYRVLPGNHDHAGVFTEVFADQGEEFFAGGYRWISFYDYEQEGHRPRRLGPAHHLFRKVLADADSTPQVHLQHYPLHTPPTGSYPYAYEEAAWLRKQIAASGKVRLSLSGHYHYGTPLVEEAGTTYTGAEALCDTPHRWRIYELTSETITHETFSLAPLSRTPVVFLDRDGVINDLAAYTFGPERMRLIPGAAAAIRQLSEAGIRTAVVTSQSAIAAGYVTRAVVEMVNEEMQRLLALEGAALDAIYYTAGAGEGSVLPGAELWPTAKSSIIRQGLEELPVEQGRAWIVGDRMSDMEAGAEAGIRGILVRTGFGKEAEPAAMAQGIPVVDDLAAAAKQIIASLHR